MIRRSFYFKLIARVSLLVIFSVLMGCLLTKGNLLPYSIICLPFIIILTINLISFLNSTNKKIRFFFDAVRNDDSSIFYSGDSKNKEMRELYQSMNRVNQQIQQLKIENRQQEQFFRTLLEHLATGIITFNDKGFILHANSSAKKLLSTEILTHLQQIERVNKNLYQVIASIKPSEQQLISFSFNGGDIKLSLKATSLKSGDENLMILSVQDIKDELDEKELDAWLKLIRVLMHEIMNSITPITSLSESLSGIFGTNNSPILPEQVTEKTIATTLQGLNVIREQSKGLMSFVESYRKLTRVPKPEKKLFKISDLISRVEILYKSLGKSENIDLSFSMSNPGLELFADENLITQVLINLIKNALEANENNTAGKIRIVAGLGQNHHPEICVIDNGPGISEELIDEIFVPFFTTRENGSGIGLSISKQIMRIHGGNIKVHSMPNKETVFCLSFQS
jgi:two-component system, NtrC family, nitrogen regulation sensor histidine kinase NtrY